MILRNYDTEIDGQSGSSNSAGSMSIAVIDPSRCFECGDPPFEWHHVVPQSRGGTKMVPLCSQCHDKVHRKKGRTDDLSALSREGIERARRAGKTLGRPSGLSSEVENKIIAMYQGGGTLTSICKSLNGWGIPTSHGGALWYAGTIRYILSRAGVYRGRPMKKWQMVSVVGPSVDGADAQ